jgi:hypothetical protein
MPKVLAIEDDWHYHDYWKEKLGDKVELISAFSIEEAEEKFAANPDVAAIVVNACVRSDEPNTPPLVRKFRATFTGPMFAVSCLSAYKKKLMLAGCDYQSGRGDLPEILGRVLGI